MKEVLQEIDRTLCRAEQLRQWRVDVERRSKIPLRMSRLSDSYSQVPVRAGIVQSFSPEVNIGG
jgi:hypothetical protein